MGDAWRNFTQDGRPLEQRWSTIFERPLCDDARAGRARGGAWPHAGRASCAARLRCTGRPLLHTVGILLADELARLCATGRATFARLRRACRGRMRPCGARDFRWWSPAGRRSDESPAMS
ncbi:hypothetical protein F511_47294 [Dorcoceras hygrometricum]|uniref:Uncharacterized protein n=1 Tax=Dorcoceras hygrometricum TaxID=472368 RepID=A0A2Z6ZSG5_9LAMI|nr:hypothetical protein F511_47294 [Dorcoceras hygrometricum]